MTGRAALLFCAVLACVRPAAAQEAEPASEAVEAADTEVVAPARSLEDRYVDALAGTWAGSGILMGGLGTLGTLVGLGIGCGFDDQLGCGIGALGGGIAGVSLGWVFGPVIGTTAGAGLPIEEGIAAWALGLGSHLALFGIGLGIGVAIDETQHTWGLGRVWGMITGLALGALAQMFLTPLYAVLLFEDRPSATSAPTVAISPFLAPSDTGAVGGLRGAF